MILAAVNSTDGVGLLCTILLFATIIAFIFGLAQALGFAERLNTGGGRYSGLVVFAVLLVAYLLFC